MRTVRVVYHNQDGYWWADSVDVEGFTAVGTDLPALRARVRDGLAAYLDGPPFRIVERTTTEPEHRAMSAMLRLGHRRHGRRGPRPGAGTDPAD